jgi:uncharacterized membrane protein
MYSMDYSTHEWALVASAEVSKAVFAFPILLGFTYAFAAILLKRGMREGIGPWRSTFVTNMAMGLVGALLLMFPGEGNWQGWQNLYQPLLGSVTFLMGQVFTFMALSKGDVSVATPLMGVKILFVALISLLLLSIPVSRELWIAAFLAAMAVFLLGARVPNNPQRIRITILLATCSAACFAFTDVSIAYWAPAWGMSLYIPILFVGFALMSFIFVPFFRGGFSTVPRKAWYWLLPGALFLAMQSVSLAALLGVVGMATEMNILYSTRGLWSLVLVWSVGKWLGNHEADLGPAILTRRLIGAMLLLLSVVLTAWQ